MNEILLFAGTTEGRMLAQACRNQPVSLTVCAATEYGGTLVEEAENIRVLSGRRNEEQICELIQKTDAQIVIDATHPYAQEVTQNLRQACSKTQTEYLRLVRRECREDMDGCIFVKDTQQAVEYLSRTEGAVLLTVGSKELHSYTAVPGYEERMYARILPMADAVAQAVNMGFSGKHLICMQGPFSQEMNEALLHAAGAKYLVTKDTGSAGGFAEKVRAAQHCGVKTVVVSRPSEENGMDYDSCLAMLAKRFSFSTTKHVTVLGVGPGSFGCLTEQAKEACRAAELIIGAKRTAQSLSVFGKKTAYAIRPQEIAQIVNEAKEENIVVAMSGDTGFYSGTKKLLPLLKPQKTEVLPGIGSLIYFAARIKTGWDDAVLASAHGRSCNIAAKVRKNAKVFLLTGGESGVSEIAAMLTENGMGDIRITVGENLSYPEEKITAGTAQEIAKGKFAPLSVMLAENPAAEAIPRISGLPDSAFLRAKVPMTKQEVRAVTLAKLELAKNAVCYDVGAGTGSVSLEMADCCEDGMVYAIEQKEEACELIEKNKRHLGITNVRVVHGIAPQALEELPCPTHAFIGGSGGNLKTILACLLRKNPHIRIVMNMVTAESFAEAMDCLANMPLQDADIVQLTAARGEKMGRYHLMTGQNPVYIISCRGGNNDG